MASHVQTKPYFAARSLGYNAEQAGLAIITVLDVAYSTCREKCEN